MKLRLLAALLLSAITAFGQDAKPAEKKEPEKPDPTPANFVRKHTIKINNADFAYTTTAEEIYLKDGDGKSTADFFTVYYTKDGITNMETRPVTFVFNGGPGSASMFLHLGVVGPKLLDIPSDATDPGAPPYKMRDNPSTILRATDLVFVDPVGTGYSHAMGDKKGEDFWGFDEDADSVAEFIRTFITHHNRWNSPKYILGESYGGIRTSLLIPRLQGNLNVGLNGAILVSPALNMATLPFILDGNDQVYATSLPAFAATAYYHHRVPNQEQYKDLNAFLKDVEQFAGTEYLLALFQGDHIDAATKDRVAGKMHNYLGISKDYIVRANLRVGAFRFAKELLRDQGETLGLLDGRYVQKELDNVSDVGNADPFQTKTGPIYATVFQSYLRNDLGVDWDKRYISSNGEANQKWKRPRNGGNSAFGGFIYVTDSLAQGTKDNEALRVFVAGGYNDLVVSYYALQYELDHSGIDTNRVTIKDYPGGHMMYLHRPSAEALSNDIVAFIEGAK